jgi:hypothetical protein
MIGHFKNKGRYDWWSETSLEIVKFGSGWGAMYQDVVSFAWGTSMLLAK